MTGRRADHAGRRDRLRAHLDERGAPAMVVTHRPNVRYLAGFTGSNGQLLITPQAAVLITDGRYAERASAESPDLEVLLARNWIEAVREQAAEHGLDRLAFEGDHLSYRQGSELAGALGDDQRETVDVKGAVEQLRTVKDDYELDQLRTACAITVEAMDDVLGQLEPGMTEREAARWIERRFVDLGAEDRAFETIVASGPNGAIPHHEPTDRMMRRGDLVTIDAGARVDGYHADMTRTIALGEPDPDLRHIHEVVAEAQAAGRAAATAGTSCKDLDKAARHVIDEAGLGDQFVHGLGHGVGLEIHEAPLVSSDRTATLHERTALTVEPGIYLPGAGGVRIEDTVVITAQGPPDILTDAPRDLVVL